MLRYSQLHIVLVGLGLAGGAAATLGVSLPWAVGIAVGAGSWVAYVGERLLVAAPEDAALHPGRSAWFARHRALLGAWMVLGGALVLGALARVPASTLVAAAATALVGVAYALARPLREHPVGKPVTIALAWTLGGVVVPLASTEAAGPGALRNAALLYALARAAVVGANVLLCDWPDRHGDAQAGRATLAATHGVRGLRWTATPLLVLSFCLDVLVLRLVPGPPARALGLIGPAGLLLACFRPPRGGEGARMLLDLLVGAGGLAALA